MATTPNYGFTVYASTDTAVKFLDFRTSIAGTATSSNFYKIDSLLKTVNDTLDTMDLVTATLSSGNNYTLSISKTKLKRFYTFIVKFSATNPSGNQITFTTNDSSSPASGPVYIGYTTSLIQADPYQFLPGYYYLCHYNSSNFYILGVNSGKQITVKMDATNNEEVLVCKKTSGSSSPAIIETSGMPIGSAGGFATLDSSGNLVQTANSATNATNALHANSAESATNATKLSNKTLSQIVPNYSTSETTMPYTWINGKTIYRSVFVINNTDLVDRSSTTIYLGGENRNWPYTVYTANYNISSLSSTITILPMSSAGIVGENGFYKPFPGVRTENLNFSQGWYIRQNGSSLQLVCSFGGTELSPGNSIHLILYYVK